MLKRNLRMHFRFGTLARKSSLRAAFVCLLSATCLPLFAQTVRPVIDENIVKGPGKKASGRIEYVNDTLQTLSVVLDVRTFAVSDTGEITYGPMDPAMHIKFSNSSFQIPPKQSYYVFYEAYADTIPSWCVVYATFGGFKEKTPQGFNIQVLLPHTIYLLPKQAVRKDELVVKVAEYRPNEKKVVVRVENTGSAFGRVLEADVSSLKDRATLNGFPVFPHREREVEIPWTSSDAPSKIVLHLEHFQLEQKIGSEVH